MKIGIYLSFCFYILSNSVISQIKMEMGKYPFTKVVEWPGRGALFMGDNPSGKTFEKNITLFNHQGAIDWNKSIFAKVANTHLILSGDSKYIYFVDDLQPYNDQIIRYNQVNESGSIIHTKLALLPIIKKYGYADPSKIKLRDIENTPKAIVFYIQYPVEDKDIIENIFITITHHNNLVYSIKGPATDMESAKEGKQYPFYFAGADAAAICFSRYSTNVGKPAIQFVLFSPKAAPLVGHTYGMPTAKAIPSKISLDAYNGFYYMNQSSKINNRSAGKGIYIKGHFYYVINDEKSRTLRVIGVAANGKFTV
ncbi:MAG TPA: hypothetical protein VFQ86_00755, partial [Arachidicoccus soli]|nr:hypothetical protein [Arachidicoccus soli]